MDLQDATPVVGVRLRLLPWRPRWRTGNGGDEQDVGGHLSALADLGDDPVSAVLGLLALVLLVPFVLAVLLGVALFSLEMLALLPLGMLLLLGRACHLQPWVLVVRLADGRQRLERVTGWRAVRERQRQLRPARGGSRRPVSSRRADA